MVKEECASVTTGNESDMFKHLLKELNMVDSGMEIALLPSGAAAVHTYKPSLLAACHSTVLQNGKLHRFWLRCQESCFFARDTRILPVDVESKASHPRLFVFSLPNMADGIQGWHLEKCFDWWGPQVPYFSYHSHGEYRSITKTGLSPLALGDKSVSLQEHI